MKKLTTRQIVTAGLLLALTIVLDMFSIQIPLIANKIKFTFIPNMIFASIYSLPNCIIFGFIYDTISFMMLPGGSYFFGYTFSKMLTMAVFYFFLNKEVNLKNIIISKAIVNVIINAGLGSLWLAMLYSKGYIYYFETSIIKNLVMLPIEVFVFWAVYKLIKQVIPDKKHL